jgi:hypothetical protein
LKTKIFSSTLKNALAYYNDGVVDSFEFRSRRSGSKKQKDVVPVGGRQIQASNLLPPKGILE